MNLKINKFNVITITATNMEWSKNLHTNSLFMKSYIIFIFYNYYTIILTKCTCYKICLFSC